jgi:hypothetical protein
VVSSPTKPRFHGWYLILGGLGLVTPEKEREQLELGNMK